MKRDFEKWLAEFRESIADYGYYIDFPKVYKNVNDIKIELNILNTLVGSRNIEQEFDQLVTKYPETLKCIPILLAVRANDIFIVDEEEKFDYRFDEMNYSIEQYKIFMRKTGLFDLISNHIIGNLVDYVTGVETGLDSNGRKKRGGTLMEDLVEKYIKKAGYIKNENYFKEMNLSEIEKRWGIDLSSISNHGRTEKRFDFVIDNHGIISGIEVNFYATQGSKLNETARSYKTIALESKNIKGFKFVWFTDGKGWNVARNNLEETFDVLDELYNIKDLENGIITEL